MNELALAGYPFLTYRHRWSFSYILVLYDWFAHCKIPSYFHLFEPF